MPGGVRRGKARPARAVPRSVGRRGLLGVPEYHSSEDEDYMPEQQTGTRKRVPVGRKVRAPPQNEYYSCAICTTV